ncbi:MAG: tRNA (N6-isopentenyl adenosine(37)-C2)-methylthiotransferase MiaB [Clostridia bacterium]|nr:tRNA (N6-isopentenyl adenosine(37)-C2)-methylthiotransferase MiaB [Clostridia bacterium]
MNHNFQSAEKEQELATQFGFAERVRELNLAKYTYKPLAFVHTYGCQQNVSDTEHLKGYLEMMGYGFTEDLSKADLVLYNTCAVREHAESRVFGNVGILKANKRARPGMLICMCGCMAQQPEVSEKIKKSYPYVDILFGTGVRHRFPEFVYRKMTTGKRVFENPEPDTGIFEGIPVHRDGTFKAWLPIMQGCNNFCTYCIVPYVRGRECSREPEAVIAEAEEIIKGGAKEIMLLGQNVNSYGKTTQHKMTFAELLRRINAIEGDFRIRFMTSHPKDCSDELLVAMAECEKVEKHLHLPVQCGSDRILDRMNRRYTAEGYMKLVDRAKELMPEIQLTSDIIVGFPGETEEDFQKTLELIKKVRYYSLFTFIFSPRPGTPAEKMEDNESSADKSRRFAEMLRVQEEISRELNAEVIGRKVRLLIEEIDGDVLVGRSSENLVVRVNGNKEMLGEFVNAEITSFDGVLHGEII